MQFDVQFFTISTISVLLYLSDRHVVRRTLPTLKSVIRVRKLSKSISCHYTGRTVLELGYLTLITKLNHLVVGGRQFGVLKNTPVDCRISSVAGVLSFWPLLIARINVLFCWLHNGSSSFVKSYDEKLKDLIVSWSLLIFAGSVSSYLTWMRIWWGLVFVVQPSSCTRRRISSVNVC